MKNHRLSKNLKILRERKGISQKELGAAVEKKTGFNLLQRNYSAYERSFCEPSIVCLKALADYHDLTMNDMCYFPFT